MNFFLAKTENAKYDRKAFDMFGTSFMSVNKVTFYYIAIYLIRMVPNILMYLSSKITFPRANPKH